MYIVPASRLLDAPTRALVALLAFALGGALAAGIDRLVHLALRAAGAVVLVLVFVGCGGAAFSAGLLDTHNGDAGQLDAQAADDASQPGQDALSSTDGPGIPEAGPDALDASVDAPPEHPEAGHDAGPVACMCPTEAGAVSCWYSVDEPTPGAGAPQAVTTVILTPAAPSASFNVTITTPPTNEHDVAWVDLDVRRFTSGGTLHVSGKMGAGAAVGSNYLMPECGVFPPDNGPAWSVVEQSSNVPPGGAWSFGAYVFPAGTDVLHFGGEGSWGVAGTMNTDAVTVSVQ
jgi:hypothetical protein